MKAAVRDRYGPPALVRVEEVPKPDVHAGEVLVRVHAASVNRADIDGLYPRWQFVRIFLGLRRPRHHGLGIDVAGAVEAVGEGVARFKVGDRVFAELFTGGIGGGGTFAEYVGAPEKALEPIPEGIADEVAAALPHSGVLALQGLRRPDGRTVRAGERLLVVGASGNVGSYLVQIGKAWGAHVTGVASGAKLDFVRSLGADEVIDYQTTDYTRPAEPYDWIVDVDAHHSVLRWRPALTPHGVYVAMGGPAAWLLSGLLQTLAVRLASPKRMGLLLWWKPFNRADVQTLLELVEAGKVKPAIDRTFPLDGVVDALRWVDDGMARGKVIVAPRAEFVVSRGRRSGPANSQVDNSIIQPYGCICAGSVQLRPRLWRSG